MIDIRYCILRNTDGYLPFISRMLLDFIIPEYFPLVDGKFFFKTKGNTLFSLLAGHRQWLQPSA